MALIEHYEEDGSAISRLDLWRASLRITEEHPFLGGGFNVTLYPNAVNPLLLGTDIPRYTVGKATHSSHFQVLSEHGWVGYGLFFMIGAYSWFSCSWLIRHSRSRRDLAWANVLGRMGQAALLGYWVGGLSNPWHIWMNIGASYSSWTLRDGTLPKKSPPPQVLLRPAGAQVSPGSSPPVLRKPINSPASSEAGKEMPNTEHRAYAHP